MRGRGELGPVVRRAGWRGGARSARLLYARRKFEHRRPGAAEAGARSFYRLTLA